jgi:hypothetical protein
VTTSTEKRTHNATREAPLSFQPVGRQFVAYSGLAFQWFRAGNRWRLKSGRTVADALDFLGCRRPQDHREPRENAGRFWASWWLARA